MRMRRICKNPGRDEDERLRDKRKLNPRCAPRPFIFSRTNLYPQWIRSFIKTIHTARGQSEPSEPKSSAFEDRHYQQNSKGTYLQSLRSVYSIDITMRQFVEGVDQEVVNVEILIDVSEVSDRGRK